MHRGGLRVAGSLNRGGAKNLQTQVRWASTSAPWPSPQMVELNYQLPPPPGKRTGRYIGDQVRDGQRFRRWWRRRRHNVLCQAGKPPPVCNPTHHPPQEDKGDTVDENDPRMTKMYDGRQESPAPNLESCGFELASCPTECTDFRNDEMVTTVYYDEMRKVHCSGRYAESLRLPI